MRAASYHEGVIPDVPRERSCGTRPQEGISATDTNSTPLTGRAAERRQNVVAAGPPPVYMGHCRRAVGKRAVCAGGWKHQPGPPARLLRPVGRRGLKLGLGLRDVAEVTGPGLPYQRAVGVRTPGTAGKAEVRNCGATWLAAGARSDRQGAVVETYRRAPVLRHGAARGGHVWDAVAVGTGRRRAASGTRGGLRKGAGGPSGTRGAARKAPEGRVWDAWRSAQKAPEATSGTRGGQREGWRARVWDA
jgi:hypothetical protein